MTKSQILDKINFLETRVERNSVTPQMVGEILKGLLEQIPKREKYSYSTLDKGDVVFTREGSIVSVNYSVSEEQSQLISGTMTAIVDSLPLELRPVTEINGFDFKLTTNGEFSVYLTQSTGEGVFINFSYGIGGNFDKEENR